MLLKNTFFALLATLLFVSCSSDSSDKLIKDVESLAVVQGIHKLVNEHRVSIGKSKLTLNDGASKIALKHTEYMISINDINHDNKDDRFSELQTLDNARSFAENVAARQRTAAEVVQAWLNSPGHKRNIEGDYTHTGIGVKKNNEGHYYFTQLFYAK